MKTPSAGDIIIAVKVLVTYCDQLPIKAARSLVELPETFLGKCHAEHIGSQTIEHRARIDDLSTNFSQPQRPVASIAAVNRNPNAKAFLKGTPYSFDDEGLFVLHTTARAAACEQPECASQRCIFRCPTSKNLCVTNCNATSCIMLRKPRRSC